MTRRIFTGALCAGIAQAEGRGEDAQRQALLRQSAAGMLELIRDGLVRDGAVRLHQFGTFRLKPVAARKGINPRTGEPLMIAAHRRIVFSPAKALLERIEPLREAPVRLPELQPPVPAEIPANAPPSRPVSAPPPAAVASAPPPEPSGNTPRPRRWIATAALLAVITVLAIALLPDRNQTSPTSAATRSASPAIPPRSESVAPPPLTMPPTATATAIATPAAARSSAAGEAQTTPDINAPVQSAPAPYFAERRHTVASGDNLWRLSEHNYREPILWPHIFRANHDRLSDPDLIYRGAVLTLPELQGSPDMLSARDRERIAEGYFMVYQRYEAQHRPDAIYALIGTRWFDPAVYERHRDDLGRQRLRIMELSPLYGDGVPRLLAATFYPSR